MAGNGEDRAVAALLLKFDEFYSAGGCLDLLFHPQETAFTLLELRDLLAAARLQPVCVFFASLEQDRDARRQYREAGGTDAAQSDLALWHRLEERNPELFGRMNHVYARYVPDG